MSCIAHNPTWCLGDSDECKPWLLMQKHLCLIILCQPAKAIRFLLLWQACPLYLTPFFLVISVEFYLFFFSSLRDDLFCLFSQLAFSGVLLITSRTWMCLCVLCFSLNRFQQRRRHLSQLVLLLAGGWSSSLPAVPSNWSFSVVLC